MKMGLVIGSTIALAMQVWSEIRALTGLEPYSEQDDTGSQLVTFLLAAAAACCGWLGWLLWKRLESRRRVPHQLEEALKRADRARDALIQHRCAIEHNPELRDLSDQLRTLNTEISAASLDAAEALHQACDDAEGAIAAELHRAYESERTDIKSRPVT